MVLRPSVSLPMGTNLHVALMTATSSCLTSRVASPLKCQTISLGPLCAVVTRWHQALLCHVRGGNGSLLELRYRGTNRTATVRSHPTVYTASPFLQMDWSPRARAGIDLCVPGMQLLVISSGNIYSVTDMCSQFISLPPVDSWHQ